MRVELLAWENHGLALSLVISLAASFFLNLRSFPPIPSSSYQPKLLADHFSSWK
jgi:hypothetical protein